MRYIFINKKDGYISAIFDSEIQHNTDTHTLIAYANKDAKIGHTVSDDLDADFKIENGKLVAAALLANNEIKRIKALQDHTEYLQS